MKLNLSKRENRENAERAQRARNIMDAYSLETGCHERENLRDLLADLKHMAATDCEVKPFDDALDAARSHFEVETTPGAS